VAWRQWLKTLLALVILSGLAELILPGGGVNKFAKLVLGLVIMLAVLQPLQILFGPGWEIPALELPSGLERKAEDWANLAAAVQTAGARPFLAKGDPALAGQLEVLLLTLEQVDEARVSIKFSTDGIEGVLVELSTPNPTVWAKAKKITAGCLNIAENKITVAELGAE